MGKIAGLFSVAKVAALFMVIATLSAQQAVAQDNSKKELSDKASVIAAGRAVAFDRRKGHCLACHEIAGGELPGNVGPALAGVKDRYPDKSRLRALINDARTNNPNTIMPPFGTNKILTEDEVDKVVEFVLSL